MASNYQLSHLRPCRGSNPGLRGGRRECYHSASVAPPNSITSSKSLRFYEHSFSSCVYIHSNSCKQRMYRFEVFLLGDRTCQKGEAITIFGDPQKNPEFRNGPIFLNVFSKTLALIPIDTFCYPPLLHLVVYISGCVCLPVRGNWRNK